MLTTEASLIPYHAPLTPHSHFANAVGCVIELFFARADLLLMCPDSHLDEKSPRRANTLEYGTQENGLSLGILLFCAAARNTKYNTYQYQPISTRLAFAR